MTDPGALGRDRDVQSTPVLSVAEVTLEDLGRQARSFDGLGFSTAWLWALVRSESRQFQLVREYGPGHASLYYVLEVADDLWSEPTVRAALIPGSDRLYQGTTRFELRRSGESQLLTNNNPLYPSLRIELAPRRITWSEADLADIAIELRQPTLHIRIPGAPDDCGYGSSIGWVTGTVAGEPVSGFGGLDRSFNEAGITWGQCKMFRYLEEVWFVWANRLDDGRAEHGWFVAGPCGFAVAGVARDGEPPVVDERPGIEYRWEEQGDQRLIVGAELTIGTKSYVWTADRNVTIPGMNLFVDWLAGRVVPLDGPLAVEGGAICEYFKQLRST